MTSSCWAFCSALSLDCSTLLSSLTGVPSFVVTLGSFSIFSGLALQILQGRAITFNSAEFDVLAIGEWIPPLQNIALYGITVWMAGVLISRHTRFGRYIYLIGGGEAVARNSGIPVGRYKIYAFTLSGLIAGFGGVLAVVRLGAARTHPWTGSAFEFSRCHCRGWYLAFGRCRRTGPYVARGINHHHSGQWIEPAWRKLLSAVSHQRGGGDRCRADQPKLTSDFVGEMIACNMGSLLIFGEESRPLSTREFLVTFRNGRSRLWLRPLDPYEDDINQNFTVGYKTAGSARGFLSIWLGH